MQLEAKQAQYAWIEQKINYFICFVPLAVFLASARTAETNTSQQTFSLKSLAVARIYQSSKLYQLVTAITLILEYLR